MADIRVLIVDDEPLARRGIRQLLAPYADFGVVGEARNGREALRLLEALKPDLLFLDIQMPGLDGFGVLRSHGIDRMPTVVFVADALATAARLTALLKGLPVPGAGRRIAVPTDNGELLLDPGEIDWIEADDYYAGVHAGGRHFRVRESLAALEARLDPSCFVRVHRSAIVRLDQIRELRQAPAGGGSEVLLLDGTRLPVSRRRQSELRSLLRRSTGRSPP
jgi:two-component system LytT family response regulator